MSIVDITFYVSQKTVYLVMYFITILHCVFNLDVFFLELKSLKQKYVSILENVKFPSLA